MDYHELQKTRVADLRDMMKEHLPDVVGVIGLLVFVEVTVDALGRETGIHVPGVTRATPLGDV